jgi:hypothetical protein
MDIYDNLTVRVCKNSKPTLKKLRKVFAMRCYVYPQHVNNYDLADYLLGIIDEYNIIPKHLRHKFILEDCAPSNQKFMNNIGEPDNNNHLICVIRACVSKIRLSTVDRYGEDYRKPLKFK